MWRETSKKMGSLGKVLAARCSWQRQAQRPKYKRAGSQKDDSLACFQNVVEMVPELEALQFSSKGSISDRGCSFAVYSGGNN